MRRISILAVAFALLPACQKPDRSAVPRHMREQGRFSEFASLGQKEEEKEAAQSLYLTAVSNEEILLFKDGEIVARAPAGPNPESHRARGGHLYSEIIDGHETVHFKDGKELFRYSPEEVTVGFTIVDGDIHTLGQRAGQGFSYRINGEEVFSDPAGRIVGTNRLSEWDGGAFSEGLHYAYGKPLGHSSTAYEYHVMRGAETVEIFESGSADPVFDIRVIGGKVYVAKETASGNIELVSGGESSVFMSTAVEYPHGVWIAPYGDGAMVKWCGRNFGGNSTYWIYAGNTLLEYCEIKSWGIIPDMLAGGHYVTLYGGKVSRVFSNHSRIPVEVNRYTFTSPLCAALIDGEYHVALSDADSGTHIVLAGRSEPSEWHFPGYFTSIRRE